MVWGFFLFPTLAPTSNRSAKRCMVAVRKRGARQKSLLLWMRRCYGVVQPSLSGAILIPNMGKINLLIANANDNFEKDEVIAITNASSDVESFISLHFEFDYDVDVVVTAPSFLMKVIPEDGISARTYNSRLIILVLDKKQAKITEDKVYEILCHEMSHSLRWEKLPEYSDTLFKGIILEGLAIVLEEKALSEKGHKTPQFFFETIRNTNETEYHHIINVLKESFENENYDYEKIFYTGDESLPRWAGYRLGYYYVKQYLESKGRSIEEATVDSYSSFSYK